MGWGRDLIIVVQGEPWSTGLSSERGGGMKGNAKSCEKRGGADSVDFPSPTVSDCSRGPRTFADAPQGQIIHRTP